MGRAALAQDACVANFTHGGDPKTGLTFSSNVMVSGVDARGGLAQMKTIAAADGFEIGADQYQGGQGTLTINQKAKSGARGFPAYVTASDAGNVTINLTLPAGMQAKPEDVRKELCGMLARLAPGSVSAGAGAASAAVAPSSAAASRPTMASAFGPVDTTKLCMTNFTTALNSGDGDSFATWSMTSSIDPHEAIARMKQMLAPIHDYAVASEEYHGHEGELMVVMKSANTVRDSAFYINGPDARGFPFHITVDGDLAAMSFVAQVNPDQTNIIAARMEYVACGLIAAATGSQMPPDPPKSRGVADSALLGQPTGFHFVNPFTNTPKARMKKAQQETESKIDTRQEASMTLYRRALASGKAVVIVPGLSSAAKYNVSSMIPGSPQYPAYSMERDSTFIWQNKADERSFLKVGFKESMDRVGLHGYLTGIDGVKSYYMFYIVEPGNFSLTGDTYKLRRTEFPDMSSKQWNSKAPLGLSSLAAFKDKEYYQTQEWFDAQYGQREVSDGSYCDMIVVGGGAGGCAHVTEMSHSESYVKDPGGWRDVTKARMVDGVAISTKLTREFASFTVSAGEALLVDGFYASEYNTALNTNACNQADDNLVNCSIKSFTLYRITPHVEELRDDPRNALDAMYLVNAHMPFDTSLIQYRPVKMVATPGEDKPGTFEAGWAKSYSLSVTETTAPPAKRARGQ